MKHVSGMMLVCLPVFSATLWAAPEPDEAERLVRQLGSTDFAQREAAAKALLKLGPAALPALEKARQSDDAEVRKRAHDILARLPPAHPADLVRRLGGRCFVDSKNPKRPLLSADLSNTPARDDDLAYLSGCDKLEELRLEGTLVTVAGLKHLRHLHGLKELHLPFRCMTDEGLRCLTELHELGGLELLGPGVTDRGAECLQAFPKLRSLILVRSRVTDEGLRHLAGMTGLGA